MLPPLVPFWQMLAQGHNVVCSGKDVKACASPLWRSMWACSVSFQVEASPSDSLIETETSYRSLGIAFLSCSTLDVDETDSFPPKSFSIKNTFIHLDKCCVGSDDAPALPPKSISAPSILSQEQCTSDLSVNQRLKHISDHAEGMTEATHIACVWLESGGMASDEDVVQRHATQTTPCESESMNSVHSIPYVVKNTFIHIEKPFDEESNGGMPKRSTSAPILVTSSPSSGSRSIEADDLALCDMTEQGSIAPAITGMPSVGAALHDIGQCKPCAWFWKPSSCSRGEECGHCHLCPEGEIYRRRKSRRASIKAERARIRNA